jgi:hypothetical protein
MTSELLFSNLKSISGFLNNEFWVFKLNKSPFWESSIGLISLTCPIWLVLGAS